jgi:hypothetical protein
MHTQINSDEHCQCEEKRRKVKYTVAVPDCYAETGFTKEICIPAGHAEEGEEQTDKFTCGPHSQDYPGGNDSVSYNRSKAPWADLPAYAEKKQLTDRHP